jgi:hypothetical protein
MTKDQLACAVQIPPVTFVVLLAATVAILTTRTVRLLLPILAFSSLSIDRFVRLEHFDFNSFPKSVPRSVSLIDLIKFD